MAFGTFEHGLLRDKNGVWPGRAFGQGPHKLAGAEQAIGVGEHGANQEGAGALAVGRRQKVQLALVGEHGAVRQDYLNDEFTARWENEMAVGDFVAVLQCFVFREAEIDVHRVHL